MEFKKQQTVPSMNLQYIPKAAAFQSVIDKYTMAGLPGIAILIRDKNGLWVSASGKADIEEGISMKPCIISKGASTTKTFIAVLTLLLAEEGKLDLDDKIEKWLPSKVIDKVKNTGNLLSECC
ncbi:MAG: beta-lactamase family protein [Saprospiraceae bacterium]|nr:beta-lactamase family protein [Saprospiraceae bacterium]